MKILVLENYSATAIARLQAEDGVKVSQKLQDLEQAEVLLVRSRTQVNSELLQKAPNLKLIVTATSGFDHIDWRQCLDRGITVTYTAEANAPSTAELTFALILSWARHIPEALRVVREGNWREQLSRPPGLEMQTLGVVGLGRVGGRVARIAKMFGLKVQAFDPYVDDSMFATYDVERTGFIELLKTSDWVSLHVPLTSETRHLMDQSTFKEMQAEAVLVNTCRGPVVSENDLLVALDGGTIAGCAMDVLEREPPARGHRLLQHPNLLLTPHIGAYTERAWEKASHEAVEKVLCFRSGDDLLDTLPLDTPWFEKT